MLVEDEPIVRLAIKSLVNWKEMGFLIGFEAANGKQALNILEENPDIDIIITDINMPIMDGLEFISKVSESGMTPEIIVLSAYNEYDWVRKSFKLGVNDYILKTEMEPEGILEIVKGVAAKIEKRKKVASQRNSGDILHDIRFLKDKKLTELLENGNIESLYNDGAYSYLNLKRGSIAICYLWIDNYDVVKERYINNSLKEFTQSVFNSIDQILNETNTGEVLCQSPEEYILFLSFNEASQKQIRSRIMDVLGRIQYSLRNYVNISVSIGVSDVKRSNEPINCLFEQASQNVKLRFIVGKGKI